MTAESLIVIVPPVESKQIQIIHSFICLDTILFYNRLQKPFRDIVSSSRKQTFQRMKNLYSKMIAILFAKEA